jgi:hypothetical protein
VDILAAQLLPQSRVGVGVQSDHIDQKRVVDVSQPFAEIVGNQVLYVLAHGVCRFLLRRIEITAAVR